MGDYVLKVRLSDERKVWLDNLCMRCGLTMSEVVKALFDAIENNRIEISDKEVVATSEMLDIMRPVDEGVGFEFDDLKFTSVLRLLRKNGYPDSVIRQMNEQQMMQISDGGRYNPRRFRDEAC